MARGLGMTAGEWLDLRGKVDESFWVMRIIGERLIYMKVDVDKQIYE